MNELPARQRLPGEPRITVLGGGGGGVGRSTAALELARYLVRRGRRVLLVDACLAGDDLAGRLEVPRPREPLWRDGGRTDVHPVDWIVEGDRKNPALLPLGRPCRRVLGRPAVDVAAIVARLRTLAFDHVIVDADGDVSPETLAWLALADVPVLTTTTEPASLARTTTLLRALVVAGLAHHGRAAVDGVCVEQVGGDLPAEWEPADLHAAAERHGATTALDAVLRDLRSYVLVLQTREAAERELAHALCLVWEYLAGTRPRVLGAIDYDDRRWFHLRQDVLAPALASELGTGVQLDEVGRRLDEIGEVDREQPRHDPRLPRDVARIAVPHDCEPTTARLAYRRLWEGLRRESAVSRRLVSPQLRARIIAELEDANRGLLAWLAERPNAQADGVLPVATPPAPPNPGRAVTEARERLGLSLRDVSLRTRIDTKHLDAIEQFRVEMLPRAAYLRGYLREIAAALQLRPEPLMETYLDAVNEARTQRILRAPGGEPTT